MTKHRRRHTPRKASRDRANRPNRVRKLRELERQDDRQALAEVDEHLKVIEDED